MQTMKKSFLRRRIDSFGYAFTGIWQMLITQHNVWIHLIATVAVVAAGVALRLSTADWIHVIIAIALVWSAEAINTAFEFLCDVASPEFHPLVEKAKNIAAAAVLICAVAAACIGLMVFIPYF